MKNARKRHKITKSRQESDRASAGEVSADGKGKRNDRGVLDDRPRSFPKKTVVFFRKHHGNFRKSSRCFSIPLGTPPRPPASKPTLDRHIVVAVACGAAVVFINSEAQRLRGTKRGGFGDFHLLSPNWRDFGIISASFDSSGGYRLGTDAESAALHPQPHHHCSIDATRCSEKIRPNIYFGNGM